MENKNKIENILESDFKEIIHKKSTNLRSVIGVEHFIQIHDGILPIKQTLRRHTFCQRDEIKKHIDQLLENDIIEESSSPWAFNVIIVPKKDGNSRLCIDYRQLNAVTKKNSYPLPRIDDVIESMYNAKIFSTIDLSSGYYQIKMDPSSAEKTAFLTPNGHYQFKKMPFGLCNAPATFQSFMNVTLKDIIGKFCLVYIDDIIVFSNNSKEHMQHIKEVFKRLKNAGITIKLEKSKFCTSEVKFLEYIISSQGIQTDPDKLKVIKNWKSPINVKELQRFIGFASYYRRFIKNFAKIATPLYTLIKKDIKWMWSNSCEKAFNNLKDLLINAPGLKMPNWDHPFIVDCDASNTALGCVLSQDTGEGERPIYFASQTLSTAEMNYSTTRKELLSVVYGLEKFRPYLFGQIFTVRSDHNSLTWLTNFKNPTGQVARWLEKLSEYNFKIIHRKGALHTNADALSRNTYANFIEITNNIDKIREAQKMIQTL